MTLALPHRGRVLAECESYWSRHKLLLLLWLFDGPFGGDPVEDKWAACCRTSPDGDRSLGDRDRPTVPYWYPQPLPLPPLPPLYNGPVQQRFDGLMVADVYALDSAAAEEGMASTIADAREYNAAASFLELYASSHRS